MLDYHLERKVTDRVTIVRLLCQYQQLTIQQICQQTSFSYKKVMTIIGELQEIYADFTVFHYDKSVITLRQDAKQQKEFLLHRLYQESLVLKVLTFFLSDSQDYFDSFAQSEFISLATAYRVKQKCQHFLASVGLSIHKNHISGPEYRVRYLIALLQYRYGCNIYPLTNEDMSLVESFVLASNAQISQDSLSFRPESFHFFAILIALTWKRQTNHPNLPDTETFRDFKQLFSYDRLQTISQEVLTSDAWSLSETDIDYLFLVYLTLNTPLFKDQWTSKDIEQTLTMVTQKTPIRHLILKFEQLLGPQMTSSQPFLILMVFLMKQCFLNLQCLTPYQEATPFSARKEDPFFALVDDLISEWAQEVNLTLTLTPHRFTIQLIEMIKSQLPPIAVYVFANTITNLHTLTMILSQQFSSKTASIEGVNFLSEPLKQHRHRRKSLILAEHNCLPYLKTVYSEDDYVFVEVASDAYELYQEDVFNAFHQLRQEQYQTFIASICDRHKRLKNHDTY